MISCMHMSHEIGPVAFFLFGGYSFWGHFRCLLMDQIFWMSRCFIFSRAQEIMPYRILFL